MGWWGPCTVTTIRGRSDGQTVSTSSPPRAHQAQARSTLIVAGRLGSPDPRTLAQIPRCHRPAGLTGEEDRHLRERMPSTSITPRTASSPRSSSNEIDRRSAGLANCSGSSKRALAARRSQRVGLRLHGRDSVIPHMSHRAGPALMPSGTGSALRLWVTFFCCERTLAAPQQPVLVCLDGTFE